MSFDVLSLHAAMSEAESVRNASERNSQNDDTHGEAPSSGNANNLQPQSTSRRNAVLNKSRTTAKSSKLQIPKNHEKGAHESDSLFSSDDSHPAPRVTDNKRKHKRQGRSNKTFDNRSSSSSSDSSDSESSSSESFSDSESNSEDGDKKRKHGKVTKRTERSSDSQSVISRSVVSETISNGSVYRRFNPVKKVINTNKLTEDMQEYVEDNFNNYIKDDDIETSILSTAPVPECGSFRDCRE